MKVSLLLENIVGVVSILNKVIPTRPQIPILSNVLLLVDKTGFYIKATDLEMGAVIKIPAKIEEEGGITIPGKEFVEVINSMPKDKITIEQQKDEVVLRCRDNKVNFSTITKDEFPQLFKEKGEQISIFLKDEFINIFSYLTFSVSFEETRPQLTGVFVDAQKESVNFVATDGYRMSVKTIPINKNKITSPLIVSVRLINEIISIKGDDDVVLYINKEENQVVFEAGAVTIVGRMIEGAFPDYRKVIPQESKTTVVFDREELLQNVRLSSVFARENSNIVNLEILGNILKLTTKTQGVGGGETLMECRKTGEDNKISFNIKYLLDFLKTISEKEVTLKLNSPTAPALFEIKEKNFIHVIMPIQAE